MKVSIDGEVLDFTPGKLTNIEAMAIERVTGCTFTEWTDSMEKGGMLAITALVWTLKRRSDPTIRFDDVTFELGSVEVDGGDDEADPKESPDSDASP